MKQVLQSKGSYSTQLLPVFKLPDFTGIAPGLTYTKLGTKGMQDKTMPAARSGRPCG